MIIQFKMMFNAFFLIFLGFDQFYLVLFGCVPIFVPSAEIKYIKRAKQSTAQFGAYLNKSVRDI